MPVRNFQGSAALRIQASTELTGHDVSKAKFIPDPFFTARDPEERTAIVRQHVRGKGHTVVVTGSVIAATTAISVTAVAAAITSSATSSTGRATIAKGGITAPVVTKSMFESFYHSGAAPLVIPIGWRQGYHPSVVI